MHLWHGDLESSCDVITEQPKNPRFKLIGIHIPPTLGPKRPNKSLQSIKDQRVFYECSFDENALFYQNSGSRKSKI